MGALKLLGLGLTAWQSTVRMQMWVEQQRKYQEASAYAQQQRKPLLVVGGPYGSPFLGKLLHIQVHGCGDVCLDLAAEACERCPEVSEADVRQIPFADGHFAAAYVSHVLEHLPSVADCQLAIDELYRVADRVWVMAPPPSFLYAWVVPGHHLWVKQVGEAEFRIQPWPNT